MPFDHWEQFMFATTWIMQNYPQNEDYHHFEIIKHREKEYQENLEFYDNTDYEVDLYDNEEEYDDYDDNYEENYNDSSSDSEYEDIDYI